MQFLGIFQAMVPLFYWALTDISNAYELFVNNKLFDFEKTQFIECLKNLSKSSISGLTFILWFHFFFFLNNSIYNYHD